VLEKLIKAKQTLKNTYSIFLSDPDCLKEEELSGNNINEKLESIDNVSLQDIKNLYHQIISNSDGKVVVTIPKHSYSWAKSNLINVFSTGIPHLKKYQEVENPNKTTFKPLNKTKIFTKASNDGQTKISQSFKIIHNGNINDVVAVRLLSVLLGENEESRLSKDLKAAKKLANEVYTDCYEYTENKSICFNIKIPCDNYDSIKKCLEGVQSNINDLISTPVSDQELNKAKITLKKSFVNTLNDSASKNDILSYTNPYGVNYINEYIDTIDKITPTQIQKAAKLFLTQPSVISITSDKKTLENNKEYLASQGEIMDLG